MVNIFRRPSAFLPVVMWLIEFAVVIIHLITHGPARQPDEGTAAHNWQRTMR